jgi:hypothetical protein
MDLRLYGLQDLADEGHDACNISAFCRNPLHPGPCKGWKHTLKAVAPGLHKAVEDTRLERVHARRKERADKATAEGRKAPRVRKLKHEREATKKTGPRDGDGDGKLREGEEGKTGRRVTADNGDVLVATGKRGKGSAKTKAALAKWDASGGTGKGMTDDEVGLALTGAQDNGDYGTAQEVVTEYKKRVLGPDGKRIRKGTPPKKRQGGKDVGSTRTDPDGKGDDNVEPREIQVLKGPAQRAALNAVRNAGSTGYENKRGFVTKKQRDKMVADGLVELRDDGRLYITPHGRAVHEASIPRRNGEEILWDGMTASERAAEAEAAKGAERKRLQAEAEAQFRRGIPSTEPRPGDLLGGPGMQRVRDSQRKVAALLQKDLGEGIAEFNEDVSPAAREWQNRSLDAENIGATWRQQQARAAWLRSAAQADPDSAAEYNAMADQDLADAEQTDKRWDAAIEAASAARDALGEVVVARYKAKGKRKSAAALKLPSIGKDTNPNDSATNLQRGEIDAEVARREGGLAKLVDDLTPAQQQQGRAAGNAYTAAVVDNIKANAELDAARYEASVAHARRSEADRVPSLLRNEPKYAQQRADAQAASDAANRRENAARERVEVTKEQRRRAAAMFQGTADALVEEQNQAAWERHQEQVISEVNAKRAAHQKELDAQVDAVRKPMPATSEPFAAQVDKVAEIAATVKGFKEFENRPPYVIHDGEGSGDTTIYAGSTTNDVIRKSAPPPDRVLNYRPGQGWTASNGMPLEDADVPYFIAEWNARPRDNRNPIDMVSLAKLRRRTAEKAAAAGGGADTMPA